MNSSLKNLEKPRPTVAYPMFAVLQVSDSHYWAVLYLARISVDYRAIPTASDSTQQVNIHNYFP